LFYYCFNLILINIFGLKAEVSAKPTVLRTRNQKALLFDPENSGFLKSLISECSKNRRSKYNASASMQRHSAIFDKSQISLQSLIITFK
jgi:hypothetical protein